jgi:hypothetical protein
MWLFLNTMVNGNEPKKGSFLSFGKYSKTNDLEQIQ